MTLLRLLWSFVRHADRWLYLLEHYDHIWVPEMEEIEDPKPKHRTMWG